MSDDINLPKPNLQPTVDADAELKRIEKAIARFQQETGKKLYPPKNRDPQAISYSSFSTFSPSERVVIASPASGTTYRPKPQPTTKPSNTLKELLKDPVYNSENVMPALKTEATSDPNLKQVNIVRTYDSDLIFRVKIKPKTITVYLPPGVLNSVQHLNQQFLKNCSKIPLQDKFYMTERLHFEDLITKDSIDPDTISTCRHMVIPDMGEVANGLRVRAERFVDGSVNPEVETCTNKEVIDLTVNKIPQCVWGTEQAHCPYYEPTLPQEYKVKLGKGEIEATLTELPVHSRGIMSYTLIDSEDKKIFEEGQRWVNEPLEDMVERLAKQNVSSIKSIDPPEETGEDSPTFLSGVMI